MKFIAFHFMLAAFAIAVPVASSSSKHFRLPVQQDEHLKINENTIATRHTVLYTVIHDTDLEMGRVLLCSDHIDVSLKNRWLEHFWLLAAKRGHLPIANARWPLRWGSILFSSDDMQGWLCSTSDINTPYQFCACHFPKLLQQQ
jgi:hypothetical protein